MPKMAVPSKFEDKVYEKVVNGMSYRGASNWLKEQCSIFASHEAVRSCVRRVGNQRTEQENDLFGADSAMGTPEFRLKEIDRNLSLVSRRANRKHDDKLVLRAEAHRANIALKLIANDTARLKLTARFDDSAMVSPEASTDAVVAPPPVEVPIDERPDHFDEGPVPGTPDWYVERGLSKAKQRETVLRQIVAEAGPKPPPETELEIEIEKAQEELEERERYWVSVGDCYEKMTGLRSIPYCRNPEPAPVNCHDRGPDTTPDSGVDNAENAEGNSPAGAQKNQRDGKCLPPRRPWKVDKAGMWIEQIFPETEQDGGKREKDFDSPHNLSGHEQKPPDNDDEDTVACKGLDNHPAHPERSESASVVEGPSGLSQSTGPSTTLADSLRSG